MKHNYRKFPFVFWPMLGIRDLHRKVLSSSSFAQRIRDRAPKDTAAWRWEGAPAAGQKICVFVTYAEGGQIPERAINHAAYWRDCGYAVTFVAVVDDFAMTPAVPFGQAIIRENKGHDFAAWARAIAELDLSRTEVLALVNDSVFASPALPDNILAAERHPADVVGFTESMEYRWHLQSYACLFKQRALRDEVFRKLWKPCLMSRQDVILSYELQIANLAKERKLTASSLYPNTDERNPTTHSWPQLAEKGFPFVKRRDLITRLAEWEPTLIEQGFDVDLIKRELPAATPRPWHRIMRGRITESLAWRSMREPVATHV